MANVKPSKASNAEPSDKLLRCLADELLDGGKDCLTPEKIEARFPKWSGSACRRMRDIHLEAYRERHGHGMFDGKGEGYRWT